MVAVDTLGLVACTDRLGLFRLVQADQAALVQRGAGVDDLLPGLGERGHQVALALGGFGQAVENGGLKTGHPQSFLAVSRAGVWLVIPMTGRRRASGGAGRGDPPSGIPLSGEELYKIGIGEIPCADAGLLREATAYCALYLRRQGYDYRTIAVQLQVSLSWAWDLVNCTVKAHQAEEVGTIRRLHLDRMEAMLQPILDRATEGDTIAIDSALRIMAKIEALMGIEPALKLEVAGKDGGPVQMITRRIIDPSDGNRDQNA